MPVHIVENKSYGNKAYCTVNEGLGKVLRFGAFDSSVIQRLKWIETEFAPVMKKAIEFFGEVDLKLIIAQAVQMGDECHNRNKVATSLFFKEMIKGIMASGYSAKQIEKVIDFIRGNDHYFLNLSMPSCKAVLDAANGIKHSTIVTAMARNGVEFGIQISGLGKQWFTAPAIRVVEFKSAVWGNNGLRLLPIMFKAFCSPVILRKTLIQIWEIAQLQRLWESVVLPWGHRRRLHSL